MFRRDAVKESTEEIEKRDVFLVIKRLYQYIGKKNRKLFYPLFLLIALNVILSWISPLVFKTLIDEGLGGGIEAGEGDIDIIYRMGFLFFILTISTVFVRIIQGYIIQKLATLTMYNLREELFVKFQKLGLDYHDSPDKTMGKKVSYLTNDVNTIQELIQSGLLMVLGNFFLIFGALVFMILLSPQLTLVSFMIIPLIFLIGGVIFKKARKYFKELRERVSDVTSHLDESIMGMRIIKAFAVEEDNATEFINATKKEKETTLKSAKLFALIPGVVIFVLTFSILALFFSSGIFIRQGIMTQGTLIAFIFYLFQFFTPLINLIGFVTLLQNSIAAGSRIVKLLDQEPSIMNKKDAKNIKDIKGEITYEGVSFSYKEDQPVLENINVKIKAKERLALVGYTGAGKSTFIKLLSRFYDPNEGSIKVDGIDLRDLEIENLRKKIGIVLQENFLFSGTILENIKYGKLKATEKEVMEAAKKVSAHDFIMELKDGYHTIVGERGSNLSEGQRQLIAFARAIINDPPILILDEATSAIDPYSELLIQKALETLLENRTSISIAHRLSTIINSDRILVLDKGQIIEEGSHQELVKEDTFYKHLYEMQFKDPFKNE
ncbi:MAG: putative multidrug export ATP-binding/permease protein [Promethearchaeota archaeon]|nr:MAG: putative multidrug export ATP-binding/permease protein [Candidatus Lokiarchaeota archaeon]